MDIPVDLGKDFKADLKIMGGKVILTVEFAGADMIIDDIKAKLPPWLQPILDLVKMEVDSL